ncbi:MAG: hypothetical protein KF901_07220 [Myxococcales bacterium]|nr:hypothetical protein [Myxococcales bacterium]
MRWTLALMMVTLLGCEDLSSWQLADEEVFRGAVLGNDDPDCPAGGCSFIRRGFAPGTTIELELDPTHTSRPGTISTRGERCEPTFDAEPLLPIAALAHDHLSLYDFPGGRRMRSYIYALEPTRGPLAGRGAMAFVSLMRNGDVEVRIIAGDGADDCAPMDCEAFASGRCDYFGVFRLRPELR